MLLETLARFQLFAASLALLLAPLGSVNAATLRGEIVDAATGKPLPARVYVRGADGKEHFVEVATPAGTAVRYDKNRGGSIERHTTVSAHSFVADLPAGKYRVTVERGKEYLSWNREVTVGETAADVRVELRRFVDMAARGWYSGETHVHRSIAELPHLQLAEDLNVAFPLTHWVTQAYRAPQGGGVDAVDGPVRIDDTHVYWPRSTEYEIFTVDGKGHTLGAIFILGHRRVFPMGVPPLGAMARRAREDGGLFELDKHNWPWSMAIVPLLDVDLYELANNHHWRTDFLFKGFAEKPPAYMQVELDAEGMTEDGWTNFGFENYYTLLDCGFRLRPTAGSASGVHPVPLGFGRVYVHCGDEFSYDAWRRGLDAGRSFVTTGPMLVAAVNAELPGHTWRQETGTAGRYNVRAEVLSEHPIERVEVVSAGRVLPGAAIEKSRTEVGAHRATLALRLDVDSSTWLAIRAFAKTAEGRTRFAHSAPFFVDVPGKPLRPRAEEIGYLIRRVEQQIRRSEGTLRPEALAEYRKALAVYRGIRDAAKTD